MKRFLSRRCAPGLTAGHFTRAVGFVVLAALLASAGCGAKNSAAGTYHIEQDSTNVFGPGAEKILLDLRPDGTFDVKAGPMVLLDGTWEFKSGHVTFSRGQGSLVVSYRAEGSKLRPVQDGKDVPNWRWARH